MKSGRGPLAIPGYSIVPYKFQLRANSLATCGALSSPLHGTLTGTGPDYTYTPEAHYHGPDHFTVRVTDPSGATADGGAAITITPVNDSPVADTLTVSTLEEQPVPVDLTATDPDGDPLLKPVVR